MKVELVPLKEAVDLWRKDKRTLMSWARAGILKYDVIGHANSKRSQWYIETPSGRYNRIHNIIAQ